MREPGVTAGRDDVNDFLSQVRGSNQEYNARAGRTALELIAAVIALKWAQRRKRNEEKIP